MDESSNTQTFLTRVSKRRLRDDVTRLARPRSVLHQPDGLRIAREQMTSSLLAAGWRVSEQPFVASGRGPRDPSELTDNGDTWTNYHGLAGVNLVARCGDAGGPMTVVAAHLDSVADSPGADDNASGLAALLELARLLADAETAVRPMLVALDMEEIGGFGARAFFDAYADQVTEVLVLESVAVAREEPGTQGVPFGFDLFFPRVVTAIRRHGRKADWISLLYRPSSRSLAKRLQAALREIGGPHFAHALCDPLGRPILGALLHRLAPNLRNLGRSDHIHAWDRGIPAVCMTDTANFRYSAYHTPDDLPDCLDYDFLSRIVAGIATALTVKHL